VKITYIPTTPPTSDLPSLTPEGLAATLARYSRSNKGIQNLLEEGKTKSPQDIFRFVDYGHASIGGLTGGIAMALDGISMIAALKLFEFSQMADGQESSTRYITLTPENLAQPQTLGIPEKVQDLWLEANHLALSLYTYSLQTLQEDATKNPEKIRLPDKAKENEKIKQRLLKNYALDRSRNLLPGALKTNAALVMTARCWAETIKLLASIGLQETNTIAHLLRGELQKASPHLAKHSHPDEASQAACQDILSPWKLRPPEYQGAFQNQSPCHCTVSLHQSPSAFIDLNPSLLQAFHGKTNRYSQVGHLIKRQTIQVSWSAMTLAELRDLNRHRNGHRFSPLYPCGFELAQETRELLQKEKNKDLTNLLHLQEDLLHHLTKTQIPGLYTYGLLLGSQVAFEHTQPLDKFIYEAELRTGLGAHFRYAELLKQATHQLLLLEPKLQPHIQLGEAEPE
jgi:thymidylate synthase ThyX